MSDTVAELAGEPVAVTGVDGCGAPIFGLTLTGLARAFRAWAARRRGHAGAAHVRRGARLPASGSAARAAT